MKYTAVFKSNPTPLFFYETFPCRNLQSATWYAQARAKRYGWELVGGGAGVKRNKNAAPVTGITKSGTKKI